MCIADQYQRILDQMLGRVRATITSSTPLAAQGETVVAALARQTGRTVLAEERVDPSLLGGVVVDIEGTVYDGSLSGQLERMRERHGGDPVRRPGKHGHDRVAFALFHGSNAVVGRDRLVQEGVVADDPLPHGIGSDFPLPGRTLNVGEQEGNGPNRQS